MNWREVILNSNRKGALKLRKKGKNCEVKASLFSRAGVRVKRQEMGKGDRGTEVALGLLKVKKRRRKQAWREAISSLALLSFSSRPTVRKGEAVERSKNGIRKLEGCSLGPSLCDKRTNRWYIVFTLAYLNVKQHPNASIYCVYVCVGHRKVVTWHIFSLISWKDSLWQRLRGLLVPSKAFSLHIWHKGNPHKCLFFTTHAKLYCCLGELQTSNKNNEVKQFSPVVAPLPGTCCTLGSAWALANSLQHLKCSFLCFYWKNESLSLITI